MINSIASLYRPRYARSLIGMLLKADGKGWRFLRLYWQTQNFSTYTVDTVSDGEEVLLRLLWLGMSLQLIVGILLIALGVAGKVVAGLWFGLAVLISYPVVWAHVLAFIVLVGRLAFMIANPKKAGREIVCTILESQVRQLRAKHEFTVVAVAGSVGKTSTKLAIADLLSQTKRVRYQSGNYNDRVTVPLVFFGHDNPGIMNIFAWLKIFRANRQAIHSEFPFDAVVIELGPDGPGQMRYFAYTRPDIAVLTAITEEHMEFFKTLDAVAAEELTVFDYAKRVIVNGDDTPGKYLAERTYQEYSLVSDKAEYYAEATPEDLNGQTLDIKLPKGTIHAAHVQYIGQQGAKFALAASAVAHELGITNTDIKAGLKHLMHFSGRMQILPGIESSTIIDDTYNASPVAVKAALDVLYATKAKQRIAILGGMNELGDYSPKAHREVGEYCDPKKLDLVITIGQEAKKRLAPAARKRGCTVKTCDSPYEAGEIAREALKKGAVILAKGSQNRVFAEESLKVLLADPDDANRLVRQSAYWLSVKQKQVPR